MPHFTQTELFLFALLIIFTLPYLIWRLGKTDYFAPLVVIQILTGILLGPGLLGQWAPTFYNTVFATQVIDSLNGIAWWAVMLFVFIAGLELDIHEVWQNRKESSITAGLALSTPLIFGCVFASVFLLNPQWVGSDASTWQFIVGIGMSCAVTALPILILFMEKLGIFRQRLGQRILRYASLDDIAIWAVLAVILVDWERMGRQLGFLVCFALLAFLFRLWLVRCQEKDRWYLVLIWLLGTALLADWAGLHFMVGAFLAGVALDGHWFNRQQTDWLRNHILLVIMPVFFISTGLKTTWTMGGSAVMIVALGLLAVSVLGKIVGLQLAAHWLKWPKGEAWLIAWLLQTKALIMIIFANILLDKHIITHSMFTALLLMAVFSTMLTIPLVSRSPLLKKVGTQQSVQESG